MSLNTFLSKKGQSIYFPRAGVLAQTAEAKGKKYNATIGIAMKDENHTFAFSSIQNKIKLNNEDIFPYASSFGIPALRKAWQQHILQSNPSLKHSFSLPVVTAGITHALSLAGYLFVNAGDKILIPNLYWENYALIFGQAHQANIVTYNLFKEKGLDLAAPKKKLYAPGKKKILLFNFPHNPSGYSPTTEEVQELVSIITEAAQQKKIIVLIDDAYFGFVYEQNIFQESLFALLADCHENVLALKIDGASKEDYAWGLRIGFLTFGGKALAGPDYTLLEDKTAGAVRATVSSASQLSQNLILNAMASSAYQKEKQQHFQLLQKRYQLIKKELQQYPPLRALPFNSGYFCCLQVSNAEKVRTLLLEKYDTGVIAVNDTILRIAYSSVSEENIGELLKNIDAAIGKNKVSITNKQ